MGCAQSEISPQNETPKKGCTDVLWLVIYVIFWIIMIVIAAVSFVYGNPRQIINGSDSFGNTCGVSRNPKLMEIPYSGISTYDKNYLFFLDVKQLRATLKICVKKCPTRRLESFNDLKNFYRETSSNLCRYEINLNNFTATTTSHGLLGPCPALPVYETTPILNRCFPKKTKDVAEKVFSDFYELLNNWDTIEQMLSDLYSSWKEIIICVIIAFRCMEYLRGYPLRAFGSKSYAQGSYSSLKIICSLIMVSILHLLAALVSWIFMIVVSIVSIIGTALLWYTYHELRTGHKKFENTPFLAESLKNETAFLWYSIIATIITVIILVLVWVMRTRVSFLAKLFKETAHCLGSIPALFLQPVITFFFLVVFLALWTSVAVCLATANYPGIPYKTNFFINGTPHEFVDKTPVQAQHVNNSAVNRTFVWDHTVSFDPSWVRSMWWFCLISLVWGSEFILGCQQMTIAGAVSHWYFRGPQAHSSPVLYSIGKLLKYHLGSVAKGSFLITLFKIPRLILMYLHAKLSSRAEKGSDCAKCGLKCGICCFYCLEKFFRYLNHNAYTIITIERVHFCKAAAKAFNTLVNNALQVATINSVGDFILFLGKCIVTAVTGIIGLLLLKRNSELHFYAVPTLFICVFAFFIAHCILSLYEMVVDTLFMCVCEDRNTNDVDGQWKNSKVAELGSGHPAFKSEPDDQEGPELENLQTEK